MGLAIFSKAPNDDKIDRLNHSITFLLLLACAVLTCKQQYLGSPISCWVPKEFTESHKEYAEGICWAKNTYHLGRDTAIPKDVGERKAEELSYYQWVSFLLLGQAMLFQLPSAFWTACLDQCGLRLDKALALAAEASLHSRQARRQTVASVVSHLDATLRANRRVGKSGDTRTAGGCWLRACLNPPDFRLCRAYLATKLLYVCITAAQYLIINAYLTAGSSTVTYGLSLAANLTLGRPWEESGYFPRVTYCDFLIRVLGNEQRHTVQCVLQVNRLNEKVYALLWFWLLGVAVLTSCSLLLWCRRLAYPPARMDYVARLLQMRGGTGSGRGGGGKGGSQGQARFVGHLGPDGILLLSLVDCNAGISAAAEICQQLRRHSLIHPDQQGIVACENGDVITKDSDSASASVSVSVSGSASVSRIAPASVVRWESDDQV